MAVVHEYAGVLEQVTILASKQTRREPARITADMKLTEDLGFGGLDTVQFMISIEGEFDLNVPDERADAVTTVREAAELLLAVVR